MSQSLSAYYEKNKSKGWIVIKENLIVDTDCILKIGKRRFLKVVFKGGAK